MFLLNFTQANRVVFHRIILRDRKAVAFLLIGKLHLASQNVFCQKIQRYKLVLFPQLKGFQPYPFALFDQLPIEETNKH